MSVIFIDGFDKYGPPCNLGNITRSGELLVGDWTTVNSTCAIVAPLSDNGYALGVGSSGVGRAFGSNEARIIMGFRIQTDLTALFTLQFLETVTAQACVTINTDGIIRLRNGNSAGTIVASGGAVSAGTTHYLEVDLTFSNTGAYNVYLDGVSIFSGTGDLTATANAYATSVTLTGSFSHTVVDDLYCFDAGGGTNNAPLLTSPIVETTYATANSAVAFAFAAGAIGYFDNNTLQTNAPGANKLFLMKITPEETLDINDVNCIPAATSGGAKFKAVLYSDSGGSPNSKIATGTEQVGTTTGVTLTSPFSAPQTLTGGTAYWIGFITDTSVALSRFDQLTTAGVSANNTYGSGAPSTAPAMTTGLPTWSIWSSTGTESNYNVVNNNPVGLADLSYVQSSTPSDEDLYTCPALLVTPAAIYTVGVKAWVKKSDSGSRTIDLRMKSASTSDSGSSAGQGPATSYQWMASYFDNDPDTSAAWDSSGLNSSKFGYKVAS